MRYYLALQRKSDNKVMLREYNSKAEVAIELVAMIAMFVEFDGHEPKRLTSLDSDEMKLDMGDSIIHAYPVAMGNIYGDLVATEEEITREVDAKIAELALLLNEGERTLH